MKESVRAFIAIHIPSEGQLLLETTIGRLQADGLAGVRWVRPKGIHLTLKFLGDIPMETVDPVLRALAGAVDECVPFRLALEGAGVFPNLQSARVIWAGVGGELGALAALHSGIEEAMAGVGFGRETRPFSPHLTLGRVREGTPRLERATLEKALAEASPQVEVSWEVEAINLMQSTLLQSGARYDVLGSQQLGGSRGVQ